MANVSQKTHWLWAIIAVLLLTWVLSNINWTEVANSLQAVRGWQLLILIVINVAVLGVQYSRWALILHTQVQPIPFIDIYRIGLAGLAVSYFTPGPQLGGEPVQVYLLHKRHHISLTTATASVTIDKTLMMLTNFFFLFLGILVVVQSQLFSAVVGVRLIFVGGALMGMPLLLLVRWWHGHTPFTQTLSYVNSMFNSAILIRWMEPIQQIELQIGSFFRRSPRPFLLALGLSFIGWVALATEYWLMASFIGLQMTLTQTICLLTAVRLAILLPLPGGVGSIDAAQVFTLELLGLPAVLGVTLGLIIHGRDILFALAGLWWNGLTLWRTPTAPANQ